MATFAEIEFCLSLRFPVMPSNGASRQGLSRTIFAERNRGFDLLPGEVSSTPRTNVRQRSI